MDADYASVMLRCTLECISCNKIHAVQIKIHTKNNYKHFMLTSKS